MSTCVVFSGILCCHILQSLFILDTLETGKSVPNREVSSFQGLKWTQSIWDNTRCPNLRNVLILRCLICVKLCMCENIIKPQLPRL